MYFAIQASNPTVLSLPGRTMANIAQALSEIFPEATEEAIFVWNWVPIRVSYPYDLSVLFEDISTLLTSYLAGVDRSHRVYWGSNTFRAEWRLHWTASRVTIEAQWDSIAGSYEDVLNSRRTLEMSYDAFLWEWKALLRTIIGSINESGVRIEDHEGWRSLQRLEAAIPRFGRRYEEP
jgi:hypothetical protein